MTYPCLKADKEDFYDKIGCPYLKDKYAIQEAIVNENEKISKLEKWIVELGPRKFTKDGQEVKELKDQLYSLIKNKTVKP
jgi:hypothetical protein